MDDIMQNRLITTATLLTSLITSLVEELRLELEWFNEDNLKNFRDVLKILKETKLLVKECESPDQGGLYSCCAAILALVFCIFPGMVYLQKILQIYFVF